MKMKNLSRGNIVLNASIGAYREMSIKCCKVLALIIMQSSFYSLSFGLRQRHNLAKEVFFFSCIHLFHPIYTQKEILQTGKQCLLSRLYFHSYFTWSCVNIKSGTTRDKFYTKSFSKHAAVTTVHYVKAAYAGTGVACR